MKPTYRLGVNKCLIVYDNPDKDATYGTLVLCTTSNGHDAEFIMNACNDHALLVTALQAAFFALGRAGGNEASSEFRKDWEAARAVLAAVGVT